jgi:hypothetical protein
MENTISAVTKIDTVEQVIKLNEVINSLRNELEAKERETGALENHIETLENKISEVDAKQPEVRIVTVEKKKCNNWSDNTYDEESKVLEYRNLSSVQEDIRKETEAKFEKELESSKKKIKDLTFKMEEDKASYERSLQSKDSSLASDRLSYRLDFESRKRDLEEEKDELSLNIERLEKELEKVKEDKTDEQLAKQREEEIITLRTRIQDLERLVNELNSTNFFIRFWNALINKRTHINAQKEVIEKQQLVNKIKSSHSFFSPKHFYSWFD